MSERLVFARKARDYGRRMERRAAADFLAAFCDRLDDLATLAFLDGAQWAGSADMSELDEARADAATRA